MPFDLKDFIFDLTVVYGGTDKERKALEKQFVQEKPNYKVEINKLLFPKKLGPFAFSGIQTVKNILDDYQKSHKWVGSYYSIGNKLGIEECLNAKTKDLSNRQRMTLSLIMDVMNRKKYFQFNDCGDNDKEYYFRMISWVGTYVSIRNGKMLWITDMKFEEFNRIYNELNVKLPSFCRFYEIQDGELIDRMEHLKLEAKEEKKAKTIVEVNTKEGELPKEEKGITAPIQSRYIETPKMTLEEAKEIVRNGCEDTFRMTIAMRIIDVNPKVCKEDAELCLKMAKLTMIKPYSEKYNDRRTQFYFHMLAEKRILIGEYYDAWYEWRNAMNRESDENREKYRNIMKKLADRGSLEAGVWIADDIFRHTRHARIPEENERELAQISKDYYMRALGEELLPHAQEDVEYMKAFLVRDEEFLNTQLADYQREIENSNTDKADTAIGKLRNYLFYNPDVEIIRTVADFLNQNIYDWRHDKEYALHYYKLAAEQGDAYCALKLAEEKFAEYQNMILTLDEANKRIQEIKKYIDIVGFNIEDAEPHKIYCAVNGRISAFQEYVDVILDGDVLDKESAYEQLEKYVVFQNNPGMVRLVADHFINSTNIVKQNHAYLYYLRIADDADPVASLRSAEWNIINMIDNAIEYSDENLYELFEKYYTIYKFAEVKHPLAIELNKKYVPYVLYCYMMNVCYKETYVLKGENQEEKILYASEILKRYKEQGEIQYSVCIFNHPEIRLIVFQHLKQYVLIILLLAKLLPSISKKYINGENVFPLCTIWDEAGRKVQIIENDAYAVISRNAVLEKLIEALPCRIINDENKKKHGILVDMLFALMEIAGLGYFSDKKVDIYREENAYFTVESKNGKLLNQLDTEEIERKIIDISGMKKIFEIVSISVMMKSHRGIEQKDIKVPGGEYLSYDTLLRGAVQCVNSGNIMLAKQYYEAAVNSCEKMDARRAEAMKQCADLIENKILPWIYDGKAINEMQKQIHEYQSVENEI